MLNFKRQKYGQETSSDPKIWRPCNRNIVHVERKRKSDTSNNRGNWNHFIIIQKIPDQHNRKAWNQVYYIYIYIKSLHRYRSNISQPWHYMEVGGQLHTPATLNPVKLNLLPTEEEAGWAKDMVSTFWRREKILYPCWESTVGLSSLKPSHYTNYGFPTSIICEWCISIMPGLIKT